MVINFKLKKVERLRYCWVKTKIVYQEKNTQTPFLIIISLAVPHHTKRMLGSQLGDYIIYCKRLPKPTYIV